MKILEPTTASIIDDLRVAREASLALATAVGFPEVHDAYMAAMYGPGGTVAQWVASRDDTSLCEWFAPGVERAPVLSERDGWAMVRDMGPDVADAGGCLPATW